MWSSHRLHRCGTRCRGDGETPTVGGGRHRGGAPRPEHRGVWCLGGAERVDHAARLPRSGRERAERRRPGAGPPEPSRLDDLVWRPLPSGGGGPSSGPARRLLRSIVDHRVGRQRGTRPARPQCITGSGLHQCLGPRRRPRPPPGPHVGPPPRARHRGMAAHPSRRTARPDRSGPTGACRGDRLRQAARVHAGRRPGPRAPRPPVRRRGDLRRLRPAPCRTRS